MKTMTRDELQERGLKKGDVFFIEHKDFGHTGWNLVINDKLTIGLNTKIEGSNGGRSMFHRLYNTTKIIKTEDFNRITGWQGRTNQEQRDAGMLIWGMK